VADAFELLGTPPRFDINLAELEATHRELSRALHPDRYVGRPANERRLALSRAIEVNEALRALKDPVRRAEALLARHGVRIEEGKEPPASPAFLMEVLELREELQAVSRAKDSAGVRRLAAQVRQREAALLQQLGASFAELDAAVGSKDPLGVVRLLGELRYARRFLEEADAIEDELV